MRFCLTMTSDPGPCPVDDMPHTTCTSPDYGSRKQQFTVPVKRPRALDAVTAQPATLPVTTGTYKRATHGKFLRGRPTRR